MPRISKAKILNASRDPHNDIPVIRRFYMKRKEDISGNSGTGNIATGVIFPSGEVFIEWNSLIKSHGHFHSIADLEKSHGHDGATEVIFIDQ